MAPHLPCEQLAAAPQIRRSELVGVGGREIEEVRDADAALQQLPLVERRELAIRETRPMERRPEAVAGTREVMADRRGVEPGVDPAEEDAQAGRDHVGDAFPVRGEQVVAGRSAFARPAGR